MLFERYRDVIPSFDDFLGILEMPMAMHLRVNPLRQTPEAMAAKLRAAGLHAEPLPFYGAGLEVRGLERPGATLEWACGYYHMQGATSMVPPLALGLEPGHGVLDMCAAPGSKTTQLCELVGPSGFVVANEPFLDRLPLLKVHTERLGHANACLTQQRGEAFPGGLRYDRILLDAPCSGEGTERVSPREVAGDAAARLAEDRRVRHLDLERLYQLQRALLRRAGNLLAPGGVLVYSTCTYDPRENEVQLDRVLKERPDLRLEPLPDGLGGEPGLTRWEGADLHPDLAHARRYYPHRAWNSWGFFCARLRKVAATRTRDMDAAVVGRPGEPPPAAPPEAAAEHEEGLALLAGFDPDPARMDDLALVRFGRSTWLSGRGLPHPSLLKAWRPQNPGIRLFRGARSFVKPSTYGVMRLGPALRRQVVDLEPGEVGVFLRGERLERPFAALDDPRGYAAVRCRGQVLGSALVEGGALHGQIPERLRPIVSSSLSIAPEAFAARG